MTKTARTIEVIPIMSDNEKAITSNFRLCGKLAEDAGTEYCNISGIEDIVDLPYKSEFAQHRVMQLCEMKLNGKSIRVHACILIDDATDVTGLVSYPEDAHECSLVAWYPMESE